MIVLDTTVLVYAKGADHSLREPCRALIEAVAVGEIAATTTVEAIQEFVHVRARRRPREDAAKLGADYAELLSPLLNVTIEHLRSGLKLFEQLPDLGSFDAVLAAATMETGAVGLVSADTGFAAVAGLPHTTPTTAGVARLLSGLSV